jgi:hypothetical protein
MGARFELFQHQTVRAVSRTGCEVKVLIADPSGTPTWINWSFDDAETAKTRVRIVERWRRAETRLTYISRNGESALVDDAQMFKKAYVARPVDRQSNRSAFG